MFDASIQDILSARLQSLPELLAAKSLKRDIDELCRRHLPAGRAAIIDDTDTANAYGDAVFRALKGVYEAAHITLPRGVKADDAALAEIEAKTARADMLVAVGSGTINDLVKYAAFKAKKPYVLFPTAASMNGYVSKTASLTLNGHKQSLEAALPAAVFMDMETIASAPARLTLAGLGDSLARGSAQADWLLSHHVLGTTYDDAPFSLLAPYEAELFAQAAALKAGDREAVALLLKLLLLAGFGMSIAASSAPASGAEHMIAHAYGMSRAKQSRALLHGEEIAFTTAYTSERWQKLLDRPSPPRLLPLEADERMQALYGKENAASFAALYKRKADSIRQYGDHIPLDVWEKAREAIAAIHAPPLQLAIIRKQAGLPESAGALGWDEADYTAVCEVARFTRDRFTCLDVG